MSEISERQFLEGYFQDSNVYMDSVTSRDVYNPMVIESKESVPQGIPVYLQGSSLDDTVKKQFTNLTGSTISTVNQKKHKSIIGKFFSNFSRYGMSYEKDVLDNMRALPADPKLLAKPDQFMVQDLFNQLSSKWQVKSNAEKNFFEKDLPLKRESLRKLALQPELEDILDTMTNECIVYDSDNAYFAEPFIDDKVLKDFKIGVQKKIKDSIESNYYRMYKMLNWKYNAWDDFKRFLIEGSMAWEIVYDNLEKPKRIIGLIPIDAATLTKTYANGKVYWMQFKGIQGRERKLLDAQVVYIQYQENVTARQSYLERLIRPFNIYRIIEQAQIIWTMTNAQYRLKFTIPTNGMNKANSMQTLRSAMQRYKENIKFDSDSGELSVNGDTALPFQHEYWFPETDSGTPSVETIGGDGPDLNDSDQIKFYRNELYKISKIPLSRFDYENGSSSFFGTDVTSMARDEINFGRYVNRLRNIFSRIILKPLQLQLALDIPELQEAKEILDAIQLRYQSYNLFEEMFEQEVMQKRVEFVQTMKDSLCDMDPEGNEVKFFSSEFLVRKYLKMSDADLKLNKKLSEKEREEAQEFSDVEGEEGGFGEQDKETKKEKKDIIDDVPDLSKGRIPVKKGLISEKDEKPSETKTPEDDDQKKKPQKRTKKKSEEE